MEGTSLHPIFFLSPHQTHFCTSCSPTQVLLASKPDSKWTKSIPELPSSPCNQTSCTALPACFFLSSWGTFPLMVSSHSLPTLTSRRFQIWASSWSLPVGWDHPGLYLGMPPAMLGEESCLIMASDDCFSSPSPSNTPFFWDSDWRVDVSCCWKCSSTSQWKQLRGTGDG
jgi:hypothetical protein